MPTLEANAITINYEEWGDPEAPAVVLLHGFTSDMRGWMPCVEALSRDYRLIVPDLRGHGLTSAPDDLESYTMQAYVADAAALMDALEVEVCGLVGTSFGGMIALQFAVDFPQRVAALILSDTSAAYANPAYSDDYRAREERISADEAMMAKLGAAGAGRRAGATLADTFLAEGMRRRYERMTAGGFLGAASVRRNRPDLLELIGEKLTMPVLICTGDADPVHSASMVLAERLPGARVLTFRDTGHGIPWREPGAFCDSVLAFFADVEQGVPVAGRRVL